MININAKKIILLLISISVFLFSGGCKNDSEINGEIYAYANGEPIIREEIEYFSKLEKINIMHEFAEKYNISDFAHFWENEYDGNSPKTALEQRAFERAVRAKIILVLMRDNGIYDGVSYEYFRDKAQKFNYKNADATAIAGITSINMEQFYSYYIQNGELELKNILGEGVLKPSMEEITALRVKDSDSSEEIIKQSIVEEKYQKYIEDLVGKANIIKQ